MASEASVSAPLMKALRELLPGAQVVKHRDASMIGLPDCSVTYRGHALWMEFKFFLLDNKIEAMLGDDQLLSSFLMGRIAKGAETQREVMRGYAAQGCGFYVVWVHKTLVLVMDPEGECLASYSTTPLASRSIAKMMESWPSSPRPHLQ